MAPNEWRTETEADTGRERYVFQLSAGMTLMVYRVDEPDDWKGVVQSPAREKSAFFQQREQAEQWCIEETKRMLFDDMGKLGIPVYLQQMAEGNGERISEVDILNIRQALEFKADHDHKAGQELLGLKSCYLNQVNGLMELVRNIDEGVGRLMDLSNRLNGRPLYIGKPGMV